jgi:hypothetical protein
MSLLGSSCLAALVAAGGVACSTSSGEKAVDSGASSGDSSTRPPHDAGHDVTTDAHPRDAQHEDIEDAAIDYRVTAYDGIAPDASPARVPVHAELVSNRVYVAPLLFAAGEMQISGEPFASGFAGRNLGDYDRNWLPPNEYILNLGTVNANAILDLFGFSTAVESYEYSKYYMNMVVEESTAGVSLANGPIVAQGPGATPLAQLQARMGALLISAGTAAQGFATVPPPAGNTDNYLGWPGLWPSFAPFSDFDPTMAPSYAVVTGCTYTGGYQSLTVGSTSPLYECNYNTTHLSDPVTQVNRVLSPLTFGYATWKEALWAIDFAGRIHDINGNQVNTILPSDLPLVGTAGNTVVGTSPDGSGTGTYIGSSPVEGMWGLTMLADMDNAAEWIRSALLTSDGATLSGVTGAAAMSYDYGSPLVWFPQAIAVTENDAVQPYPPVTGLTVTDGSSSSESLAALLLGHSMFFGMTDPRNAGVGQRIGFQATFDGDPFPANSGTALGQATAHDRALSIIKLAFVDLDRMHADPTLGVMVDTATVAGGAVTRGTAVTTSSLAHVLIGLRQTLLSVNGAITQYGAADPDPNVDVNCIFQQLNLPVHPTGGVDSGAGLSFSERVRAVFTTNAQFFMNTLTRSDGSVVNGATVANGTATPLTTPTTIMAQASALRALIEAFLLTGDATYQVRAQAVARRMLGSTFFSPTALMFRGTASGTDEIDITPEMFGFLQSALRETYKSMYVVGDPLLDRSVLGTRIGRTNKLYLNGWDDLNGNGTLSVDAGDYPSECILASDAGVNGGLQQAEQALTGETGINLEGEHVRDRDSDCVPELAHAGHASVMAAQIHFHSP